MPRLRPPASGAPSVTIAWPLPDSPTKLTPSIHLALTFIAPPGTAARSRHCPAGGVARWVTDGRMVGPQALEMSARRPARARRARGSGATDPSSGRRPLGRTPYCKALLVMPISYAYAVGGIPLLRRGQVPPCLLLGRNTSGAVRTGRAHFHGRPERRGREGPVETPPSLTPDGTRAAGPGHANARRGPRSLTEMPKTS